MKIYAEYLSMASEKDGESKRTKNLWLSQKDRALHMKKIEVSNSFEAYDKLLSTYKLVRTT